MLVDANNRPISQIADAFSTKPPEQEILSIKETLPDDNYDYRPAPNRVTVLRHKVDRHWIKDADVDIAKPDTYAGRDDFFSIMATVVRIGGWPPGMTPWFKEGDRVTISHTMFDEVEMGEDVDNVYCGPIAAVTGVFVQRTRAETEEGESE